MKRTLDDLRGALLDEADGAASPDVEALMAGARRRVATATRRRGLAALGAGSAAVLVVGGLVATTLSTHQGLPQPAVVAAHSVKADRPGAHVVPPAKPSVNLVPDGYHGRFRMSAMVLQNRGHGPQVCGMAAASLPPQCGGPDIVGFSWGRLKAESYAGSKWGTYVLVGTFDGSKLTLTEPALDSDQTRQGPGPAGSDADFTTPCLKPAGGWRPVDPSRATDSAFEAATRRAEAESGFGGLWIDQPLTGGVRDPRRFVLNVSTTGDIAAMERKLREVWGGSLCVSKAAHSTAQLSRVRAALMANPLPEMGSLGIGDSTGQVGVDLFLATEKQQRELDARFGKGTVRLEGLLKPID